LKLFGPRRFYVSRSCWLLALSPSACSKKIRAQYHAKPHANNRKLRPTLRLQTWPFCVSLRPFGPLRFYVSHSCWLLALSPSAYSKKIRAQYHAKPRANNRKHGSRAFCDNRRSSHMEIARGSKRNEAINYWGYKRLVHSISTRNSVIHIRLRYTDTNAMQEWTPWEKVSKVSSWFVQLVLIKH
jgi:hypothetical protein